MARSYAQVGTNLWTEPTIRTLSKTQQRAYLLVLTQPELSRCGVLPYRLKRLAALAGDDNPKALRKDLRALETTRHLVVDEDAEELLVRTYVRHDGLLAQPQVVATMVSDYQLIESTPIRLAFLSELRRIWDLDLPANQRAGLLLALGVDVPDRFRDKIGAGLSADLAAAFDAGSIAPFDPALGAGCPPGFGQALARVIAPSPSPSPAPTPVAAAAPSDPAGPAPRSGGHEKHLLDLHQADLGPLPTITVTALGKHLAAAVAAGTTDEQLLAALAEWRRRPDAKPGLLPHLIADQTRTSPDPDALTPDELAYIERETARRAAAAGGTR